MHDEEVEDKSDKYIYIADALSKTPLKESTLKNVEELTLHCDLLIKQSDISTNDIDKIKNCERG